MDTDETNNSLLNKSKKNGEGTNAEVAFLRCTPELAGPGRS